MSKYCAKCGIEMADEDFLCPKCGAIWGDRIYHVPAEMVPQNDDPESEEQHSPEPAEKLKESHRKNQARWLLMIVPLCIILAVVLFLISSDWELWAGEGSNPSSATEQAPTTMQDTAPSVPSTTPTAYNVQITTETEYWLEGIVVHFCKDGQELASQQVDDSGKVTFYANKGEGYTIRLSNLVPSLAYHYSDVEISFPKDITNVSFKLENKPIDYTVRVVNTEGEPVPDVLVQFSAQNDQNIKEQVSNSEGVSIFTSDYDPNATCQIISLPNEYVLVEHQNTFEYGSFATKIIVKTYEECNIPPEHVYTIRFEDEFGAPVKDLSVQIRSQFPGEDQNFESYVFRTNQQGCITFAGSHEYDYTIRILGLPDYNQAFFFEEGSRDLIIQLIMHNYTVQFVDQSGPIAGVEIWREEEDGLKFYTSDAEGKISFVPKKDPDERVYFLMEYPPAGYQYTCDDDDGILEFFFPDDSRNMVVEFQKSNVEYHVIFSAVLPDGTSTLVQNCAFDIIINDDRYSCKTDLYGECRVELPYLSSANQISIDFTALPKDYESYLISEIKVFEENGLPFITIQIAPSWETPA